MPPKIFFVHLFEQNTLSRADQKKGRLRGGSQQLVSLDLHLPEDSRVLFGGELLFLPLTPRPVICHPRNAATFPARPRSRVGADVDPVERDRSPREYTAGCPELSFAGLSQR
jgi:hypothetical protein